MSQNTQLVRIQQKVDTISNWETSTEPLLEKEIGYEKETGKYKIGDGKSLWNDLPYPQEVGNTTSNGGEIFNDYDNNTATLYAHAEGHNTEAISEGSHSTGIETHAGSKAFKIIKSFTNDGSGVVVFNLNTVEGLSSVIGSSCTLRVANEFSSNITIKSIDITNKTITLQGVPEGAKYENDADSPNTHTVENYIVIHNHPELGDIDIGHGAYAGGYKTYAQGREAFVTGRENKVISQYGAAFGRENIAGYAAFANGRKNKALGTMSHAEGVESTAFGTGSHAEGGSTEASDYYAHAEGYDSVASKKCAHAEGEGTVASGERAHAEGYSTNATNTAAHSEGKSSTASGFASHAEGKGASAEGEASHAEGESTRAVGLCSHAEGSYTIAEGGHSHAEGTIAEANGLSSHAEGYGTEANGDYSHAEGYDTIASGDYSHAEGYKAQATASVAHAEGYLTEATGLYSHAEGDETDATAQGAHAEGYSAKAKGFGSHAEGGSTEASGAYSHAEGFQAKAFGYGSHAEGKSEVLSAGSYAHAEGQGCKATGIQSHVEGNDTQATAQAAHAEGVGTIASAAAQHVQGKYNVASSSYAHIIGNGSGSADNQRKNIHTVDWNGSAWFAGSVSYEYPFKNAVKSKISLSSPNNACSVPIYVGHLTGQMKPENISSKKAPITIKDLNKNDINLASVFSPNTHLIMCSLTDECIANNYEAIGDAGISILSDGNVYVHDASSLSGHTLDFNISIYYIGSGII